MVLRSSSVRQVGGRTAEMPRAWSAEARDEAPGDFGVAQLDAAIEAFAETAPRATFERWQQVRARSVGLGPAMIGLIDAMAVSDGGKYLRPRLVAAAFLGMGGTELDLLGEVAGAQQLLHIGLCTHDDLIDGDRMRHGAANLIARATDAAIAAGLPSDAAQRQGMAAGLLAGDLALNAAIRALLLVPAPGSVRQRLALETASALECTIAGELIDVQSEAIAPERAEPLLVAELKTAIYSVALPLRLGAIAAGVTSDSLLEVLHRIGIAFGIAYQLVDDDLGLFGTAAHTGKSVLSDVQRGKRTEHIRAAYSRADEPDRAVLDQILGSTDATEDDAEAVRGIVVRTGARDAVHNTVDEHLDRGLHLAHAELPAALAGHLTGLARTLRRRTR